MSSNIIKEERDSATSVDNAEPSMSSTNIRKHKNEIACDESEQPTQQKTTKSDNQQKSTNVIGTGEEYIGKSLKKKFHVFNYQMNLSRLYITHGLKRGCAFQIAIEVKAADTFGDFLFLYDKDEIGFFQAKHELDENKKITEEQLLSDKGDFSIPKYFNSYNKILNEKQLKSVIEGRKMLLVLNTNIDIEKSILEKSFEPVAASSILALGSKEDQKNCYSIRKKSDLYRKLLKKLTMLEAPKRVAEQLAIEVANYRNKFQVPKSFASPKNSNSLMRTFLDKLVFAVKQPNEVKLGYLVEKNICDMFVDDGISIASKFILYIQDWARQREGRYLKNEDVERQLAIWGYETLSESKMEDIKKYKCVFKKSNEVIVNVSNFLNPKQDAHTMHDVLYLYSTDTLFSKIKVCQVFETFSQMNLNQQFIFCDIGDLIEFENTKRCPVKTFSSQTCNTLFVSLEDCELNDAEEQILIRLLKIITETNYNVEQPPSNKQRKRLIMAIPENLKSKFTNNNFHNKQDIETIKSLHLDDFSNSFEDLDEISRRHLINNPRIKFNGHQVTDQFSDNNKLYLYEKDEILLNFIPDKLKINEPVVKRNLYEEEVKPYYIPRSLLPVIVDQRIKEDSQFYIVREYITHEYIGNKEVVVISSDENVFDEFHKTCTNVHWLQEINEEYVWMNSKGILTNLGKYVAKQYSGSDTSIPVTKVSDVKSDIVLISASPGMGKSILLSHIAEQSKKEDNSFVVFKINLTLTIDKLASLNAEKNVTLEQAIRFLFISTQIESSEIEESENAFNLLTLPRDKDGSMAFSPSARFSHLENTRAMEFCDLYNKEKIVLLLDRIDEIASDYCEITLNLLQMLKQSKVRKMWITTRPYAITKDLECYLETFAYTLKPLSENEQLTFFENFWKHNIKSRFIQTQPSPKDFLKLLHTRTFDYRTVRNFLGVPLHCYMVASVFAKDFTKFCSQNVADAFAVTPITICDLYSKFFDIKFDEILQSDAVLSVTFKKKL